MGWREFLAVLLNPRAIASYRLSFGGALLAAAINSVFGFMTAWTLVRYEFPGRKLIDALIDMPFALPTAVSGIALTAVFAENGWIGQYLAPFGIKVAYTWVGVVVALTLIGAQIIQLGAFARTYARVRIGERDPFLERLGNRLRLEHGLLAGGLLVLVAIAGLAAVGAEWALEGFGVLGRAYETALLATLLGLGIQIVFASFFLALLTMPLRRGERDDGA